MRPNDMPRPFAPDHSEGTTHGEGCHTWGPRHYECAMRELARLRMQVNGLQWNASRDAARILELESRARDIAAETTIVFAERDELRRRIAEADVAWIVGDDMFRSESEAIEEIRTWGPSDSIAQRVALVRLDAEEGK